MLTVGEVKVSGGRSHHRISAARDTGLRRRVTATLSPYASFETIISPRQDATASQSSIGTSSPPTSPSTPNRSAESRIGSQ
jgi:hypothetical protein